MVAMIKDPMELLPGELAIIIRPGGRPRESVTVEAFLGPFLVQAHGASYQEALASIGRVLDEMGSAILATVDDMNPSDPA